MGSETRELHVAFFPLMAPGHIIPTLDMVRLFAARGHVKTTIITTPLNAPTITNSLKKHKTGSSSKTNIHVISFPAKEAGIPEGIENVEQVTSHELFVKFLLASEFLRTPIERFLEETRPDCLVADLFYPFAADVAAKFGIPRLVFHGASFFAKCATEVVDRYKPHMSVSLDDGEFVIPTLPHEVKLIKSQVIQLKDTVVDIQFGRFMGAAFEAARKSFGEIFNSFYELEPDYVGHLREVLRRKVWHIGPVSLRNINMTQKYERGKKATISEHECLKWLDSQKPNSVIYICFGSSTCIPGAQLKEMAWALEIAGQPFIWVVKEGIKDDECVPDGFEKRIDGKGLIIRGWAPQVLILEHQAIGGFVTHCGWNSALEGISAGVPMVTWPVYAEQFYNEKLITDILKIGVEVGSRVWSSTGGGTFLKREEIVVALRKIMEGDEAPEMRKRAKQLKDLARVAVEEGGSSYRDLSSLLQELTSCKPRVLQGYAKIP